MNAIPARLLLVLSVSLLVAYAAIAADDYQLGPDSKPQEGVPKGEVLKFSFEDSKIFPGTYRDYWLYVPAQYTPDKPACLYVNQDGVQWNAPVVFDNLIQKKELPITIGVFAMHGRVKAAETNTALDRFNRSLEYDGLGEDYARFLLDELLPDVEKRKASDGRPIRFSKDGNDRAIGGSSSGGICAFTVAWEHPEAFSRVFSAIGTYVGLRGGDRYHTLIRKYEPRLLRIFLQDGSDDLNIYGGDWWMANQTLERALSFAGYEVNHVWGDGGHSGKHGSTIFPDAMRWLWKDWPHPVKGSLSQNPTLNAILLPGEDWQAVTVGYGFTEGPAVNAKGEVFFNDLRNSRTLKIAIDGEVTEFIPNSRRANGQAFGPDGRLYAVASGEYQILAYDEKAQASVIAEGVGGNDIVVANNGNVYVTDPSPTRTNAPSLIWLIKPGQDKQLVDSGIRFANGIALSPDQTQLYVTDYRSHWVYAYQIQPDGLLAAKQRYFWLHTPDSSDDAGADGIRTDREGRLYVATRMGIQVCDQAGRVQCILPAPNDQVANLCFAGPNYDTLYAMCGDVVFKRKMKVQGAQAWDKPTRPTPPRL